ncbi:MAG TPA: radical SAM protein, partial [Bacillota bacterium]|nr:radical SAM protein [Bacillota bacterium]
MTNHRLIHPCFNADVRHQYGRIHLPVAPKCNIQCNYCNRKYDCVNESRPGVTSKVLSPGQAFAYLEKFLKINSNISTVGIAGPGDPMANPDETLETIGLIHEAHPELIFCLSTNGLKLSPYIGELNKLGVTHVTVTLNAIDPAIGARIYAWVRDGKVVYRGYDGAALLLERQLLAIAELKQWGFVVKVNTIIIPGVNDHHLTAVAQKVAELGADVMNCMALFPAPNSNFAELKAPSHQVVEQVRQQGERYLPQMKHCARCRADAAGLIGETMNPAAFKLLEEAAQLPLHPEEERPYIAVTTLEGILINQHLGEADQIYIFKVNSGTVELVEIRPTPPPGGGEERWKNVSKILGDCHTLLVNGIGKTPTGILKESGINIYETEGIIDTA